MSDAANETVAKRPGRGIRIALALSLALNLAIAGVVTGVMLRDGPPKDGGRDFGLGPLSEALSHDDRKALRRAFLDRHPDIRDDRREMQADFAALVEALRAEPFDPVALDAALAAIAARNQALLDTGRDLVAERLKAMPPQDRAAFAQRLEKRMGPKTMRGAQETED